MPDLQQLYLERVRRERAERWDLLGLPRSREDREELALERGTTVEELESAARLEHADEASTLARAWEHQRDLFMREQCKAWHLREIARAAERSASRAVPGSSRYPAAVPGEITR